MKTSCLFECLVVFLTCIVSSRAFVFRPTLCVHSGRRSLWRSRRSGQAKQSRRPRHGPHAGHQRTQMQHVTSEAHGSVAFVAENDELAAEETMEILYTPPVGLFRETESLLYCGGFNGWNGDDDAMTMPMMPMPDGRHRVSITIPNFARVLDFLVTDGVRYDTGPDGTFFHAIVTHVREEDKDGNIVTYRQDPDGQLTQTGLIEKVDPLELERMIEEAIDAKENTAAPAAPMVDETISDVNQNLKQEVIVNIDEQAAVQQMRAEASVIGERLGLGNMQVNEARDAYDVFDTKDGLLEFENLGKVLEKLGFDEVDAELQAELISKHVLKDRPDARTMTLIEFMHLFRELDVLDIGIDMC